MLRESEAFLRESEARKSAVLEVALDCIITADAQGRILEFNPAAERTFGYARAEVVGRPIADTIVPPSLRAAHLRGLSHYIATGEGPVLGQRIEVVGMRKGGEEFPVEIAIVPMGDRPQPRVHRLPARRDRAGAECGPAAGLPAGRSSLRNGWASSPVPRASRPPRAAPHVRRADPDLEDGWHRRASGAGTAGRE